MQQFRFSEEGLNQFMKKAITRVILINIIMFIGISLMPNMKKMPPSFNIPMLGFFALIMVGTSFFTFKKLKAQLKTFTLTITETEIIREQVNLPTIRHQFSEITEIQKTDKNDFIIKKQGLKDAIGISPYIDNYDDLEKRLGEIKPIKYVSQPFLVKFILPLLGVWMVAIYLLFTSVNPFIVLPLGILFLSVFIYGIIVARKNKNIDAKTKRLMYFALLPAIAIIAKMYMLVFLIPHQTPLSKNGLETEVSDSTDVKTSDDILLTEIEIFTKVQGESAKEYQNGLINGIDLDRLDTVIAFLHEPDALVLEYNEVTLEIDYPLDSTYVCTLKTTKKGFTRKELVEEISKRYHQIYKEEEATATIKTVPISKREDVLNRNQTNGKYGISRHDLSDLYLTTIDVYKTKDGRIVLRINVDS